MIHVYVSNLKTSPERRAHMEKQLTGSGLSYEFFECVVGADLSEEEIAEKCDVEAIRKQNEKRVWFTRGIIGCTMTNRNIYRDMISKNRDAIMILEDDTDIPGNLAEILQHTETCIKQGDVILLFWKAWEVLELPEPAATTPYGFDFYQPVNQHVVTGGSACIITRSAAKRMLEINTPIHTTPDNWRYFYTNKCIDRLLIAYPHVVQTADFRSTMRTGKYNFLRDLVHRYRIFPVYQYLNYRRKKLRTVHQKVIFTNKN